MTANRDLFKQYLGQTSEFPLMLEVESADGVYMTQKNGAQLLDLISGIGVSNVGHKHPKVIKAIQDQLDRYMHLMVYGEFVSSPQVKLAEALADTLSDELNNVFLVNSGSEATEGSIKLAKRYTGRTEIISFEDSYHGSTSGALSVCGNESLKNKFRPLIPGNRILKFNDLKELEFITKSTAGVIIEPIQGEAGVRFPSEGFLRALRNKCNEMGALLIFDEIQVGFGRTGRFWAHEHYGISPDVLLCAKGMGGGMPIGAFISSKEIMSCLTHNPILGHITTFGGHPVSSAAALATIEVIQEENLLDSVPSKEALFLSLLQHDKILGIRSKGLFLAVEFESFEILEKIIKHLIDLGVLSDWFLFCDNSMRIAPPLIISEEEIKKACKKILQAIDLSYSNV